MRGFKNFKGSDASGPSMYSYSMKPGQQGHQFRHLIEGKTSLNFLALRGNLMTRQFS